ncbi:hypothetical protein TMU3MR103_0357 [Tetragenococcus muriaticus 3MR10-3]|uniref:Uncharacterized protein n=1 Tax=Tetragenococcus muriaticus 3MR10-3 TaxID=1302648 RepID=A0A091C703_9ENTE|nr:hypothetical protein TMU3MR103_0357 [Tetragenococcus muriaticus 3MR10-3]
MYIILGAIVLLLFALLFYMVLIEPRRLKEKHYLIKKINKKC